MSVGQVNKPISTRHVPLRHLHCPGRPMGGVLRGHGEWEWMANADHQVTYIENWWKIDGKLMEIWWKIDGKLMGNWWQIDAKLMGNWWEIDAKLMGNWWEIDGKLMENWWEIDGKWWQVPFSGTFFLHHQLLIFHYESWLIRFQVVFDIENADQPGGGMGFQLLRKRVKSIWNPYLTPIPTIKTEDWHLQRTNLSIAFSEKYQETCRFCG